MSRTQKANENFEKWFGGETFTNGYTDAEFESIAKNFLWGDASEHGALSDKQRAIVILTTLTASGTYEVIEKYAGASLRAGVTANEIRETLIQCTPYVGMEKVNLALKEAYKAFEKAGVADTVTEQGTVEEDTRFNNGLAAQQNIFGAENINNMRNAAPPALKHIQDYLSAYCFGDFYTRKTLDLKMRELITFCAIITLGGCEPQAKAHAAANISVGNTREMLIDAITQCLPFIGFPRTLNAISCIDSVTSQN
ncbi:carboxymuconolactone decarboxylase [Clostridium sp. CAG:678]|nr:carboxymuconolactone decarboxylase [Clostridium sp. CAG:678]